MNRRESISVPERELPASGRALVSDSLRMVAAMLQGLLDQMLGQLNGEQTASESPAAGNVKPGLRIGLAQVAGVLSVAGAVHAAALFRDTDALLASSDEAADIPSDKVRVVGRVLWAMHDYLDALSDRSAENNVRDLDLFAVHRQVLELAGVVLPDNAGEGVVMDGRGIAQTFADAFQQLLRDEGQLRTAGALGIMRAACDAAAMIHAGQAAFFGDVSSFLYGLLRGTLPLNRYAVRVLEQVNEVSAALPVAPVAAATQMPEAVAPVAALVLSQITWLRIVARDEAADIPQREIPQLQARLMLQTDQVVAAWNDVVSGPSFAGRLELSQPAWEWQRQLWLAASLAKRYWPRLRGAGMSGFFSQLAALAPALLAVQPPGLRDREVSNCLIFIEECLRKRTHQDEGFQEQVDCIIDHLSSVALGEAGEFSEPFPWFSRQLRLEMARQMEGVVEKGLQASLKEIERSLESLWSLSGIDAMRMGAGMAEPLRVAPSVLMADINSELLQIESSVAPLSSSEMQALARKLRKLINDKLELTLQFGAAAQDSPEKRRSDAARAGMVRDIARLGQLLEQCRRSPRNRWHAASKYAQPDAVDVPRQAPVITEDAVPVPTLLADPPGEWQPVAPDAEMMPVFLSEARMLLAGLSAQIPSLSSPRPDLALLTEVRRHFHTLKGSGRMVGLPALSEAAYAVEKLLNACLAIGRTKEPAEVPVALASCVAQAQALFLQWVDELESQGGSSRQAPTLIAWAGRVLATTNVPAAGMDTDGMPAVDAAAPAASDSAPVTSSTVNVAGDATLRDTYLAEARQLLKVLRQHGSSWRAKADSGLVVGAPPLYARAIHTLKGCSGAAGFAAMHQLAGAVHALLEQIKRLGTGINGVQLAFIEQAVGAMNDLQQAFVAGAPLLPRPEIEAALATLSHQLDAGACEPVAVQPVVAMPVAPSASPVPSSAVLPEPSAIEPTTILQDEPDPEMLPVFLAEGHDLMAVVGDGLHRFQRDPAQPSSISALLRPLHTLKGSARMAGALRLGQRMHELESRIQRHLDQPGQAGAAESLLATFDEAVRLFEALVQSDANGRTQSTVPALTAGEDAGRKLSSPMVRIKAAVLDTLLNQVGEVSIARSQLENELESLQHCARELAGNIERLSAQLRDVEIQAEIQITSSYQASHESGHFDPLELDRYTHLQELTRMMAESVNDAASLQKLLEEATRNTQGGLMRQGRLTRELQQELIATRMVKFRSVEQRFVHLIWQMAKETGKALRLDMVGGDVELDRGILEKMLGPLEHILRNAAAHGIEAPAARKQAGKPDTGVICLQARQEGNEVIISIGDDGRGLDLEAIGQKGLALGMIEEGQLGDVLRVSDLIFEPGFTTSRSISAIAGRGVGMDVVRSEVTSLGGRVAVQSTLGEGACFTMHLPASLALKQVALVRLGGQTYAIPSMLVDKVVQLAGEEMQVALASGMMDDGGHRVVLHSLRGLLDIAQEEGRLPASSLYVLFVKSGNELVAITVDRVIGNREVVTKNTGAQLGGLVGMAGATVLGNGDIALIINPLLLIRRIGYRKLEETAAAPLPGVSQRIVMVVDDSLTVRKVTERLLTRDGYLVVTAADGYDAIRQLHGVTPDIFLVDIEMPRMDGFTLVRHLRENAATRAKPIIMITSRTGEKHRERARELGVNHYLGKPYQDEQLLALVQRFTQGTAFG